MVNGVLPNEVVCAADQKDSATLAPDILLGNDSQGDGCIDSTTKMASLPEVQMQTESSGASASQSQPSSPTGSESWRCDGSPSALLRVEALLSDGVSLSTILKTVCPGMKEPPEGWSDSTMMSILSEILDQPPKREKLPQYNTFEDAIELFRTRKRILILTGAGVSVSCGIPDFRSKDGIYARLHIDFPDLPDPTAMFDIRYFQQNPVPFYDFAKEIFPGQFEPSISHKFIHQLEQNDQLLRNYTQNIDTLENQTGIKRVVECHGSFSKATCQQCHAKFDGNIIKEEVLTKRVPMCPHCSVGVIKPDIVFFGEDLGQDFHRQMALDKDQVDLLVVIGSSLKVRPVSLIPFSVAADVPQILINREHLPSYTADIELLGNCDDIIRDICLELGGSYSKMIESHEERRAHEATPTDCPASSLGLSRRTMISSAGFTKIMEEVRLPDPANEEKEEEEGPPSKRPCLADMYEQRYVSVESRLPNNSYFQLVPNRAVFPGAELYYDLECKMITRPMPHYRSGHDEDDYSMEEDDDSSLNPFNGSGRGGSEPPDLFREMSEPPSRSASCEPYIDTDSTLDRAEFRRKLEESAESAEEYQD